MLNGKTITYPFKYCKKCGMPLRRYDSEGKLFCIDCLKREIAVNDKREKAQIK